MGVMGARGVVGGVAFAELGPLVGMQVGEVEDDCEGKLKSSVSVMRSVSLVSGRFVKAASSCV